MYKLKIILPVGVDDVDTEEGLSKTIDLPFPPSPGLDVVVGTFEDEGEKTYLTHTLKSLIYDPEEQLFESAAYDLIHPEDRPHYIANGFKSDPGAVWVPANGPRKSLEA